MEDFKTNHKKHGIAIGATTAIVLKLTENASGTTAVIIGGAIGYGSVKYMEKYGHGMPDEKEYPSTLKPYQLSRR